MVVTGFHSIEEKLKTLKDLPTSGYKLYYSKPGPRVKKILAAAKEAGMNGFCFKGDYEAVLSRMRQ